MGKKKHWDIVGLGVTEDGETKPVISGEDIFRFVDTLGAPLPMIIKFLREKGFGFDVVGFCRAALRSGNFSFPKLREMLDNDGNKNSDDGKLLMDKVFEKMEHEFPEVKNRKKRSAIWDVSGEPEKQF